MARQPVHHTLTLTAARLEWSRRQGLHTPLQTDITSVVRETGWIRTLGGADAYVACLARQAAFSFSEVTSAVCDHRLQVLPAVRNCIYLLPHDDATLALGAAREQWYPRMSRELTQAGSSWQEVELAAAQAFAVLAKRALTGDALRKSLPKDTLRPLGDRGKKAGLSSVLPVALRLLEFEGKIQRSLPDGRLDSEKYVWEQRAPGTEPAQSGPERLSLLARRFFDFAAPATISHFSDWAGVSKRDATAAIATSGLVPIEIEGLGDSFFGDSEREKAGPSGSLAFLPFEDNLTALHGGPGLLADEKHHKTPVPVWGSSRLSTLGEGAHLSLRPVVSDGKLRGFWEFDPDSGSIVARFFEQGISETQLSVGLRPLLGLLTLDLGHGHSFSLDTDASLRERVTFLKKMDFSS